MKGLPKAVGIIGKSVEHVRVRALAQAFLQAFDRLPKLLKSPMPNFIIISAHRTSRIAVVLQPEYLRQRTDCP